MDSLAPGTYHDQISGRSSTIQDQYREEARAFLSEHGSSWEQTYGLNPEQLAGLIDPKNAYLLEAIGGPESLASILNTDIKGGLGGAQLTENEEKIRISHYDVNRIPEKKSKSLFKIILETLNDKILIILIVAAIISLALGIYEAVGTDPEYFEGKEIPKVDYVEGVAILIAVVIVTLVGSLNDWNKERQFVKLNRKKEDRQVEVLRDGHNQQIPVQDVLVGDIIVVQPGDVLPVDGVLLRGYDLACDESSATGESDTLKKYNAATVMTRLENPVDSSGQQLSPHDKKLDCFMLSGAKVLEGTGEYLATGVGKHSMYGRILISLRVDNEITPLQVKLNRIADGIAKFGVVSALLLFIVLFIRFLVEITKGHLKDLTPSLKGSRFMDIFIVAITVIVVAVPEGLPLAITLSLAFATTRMIKDNCLVRVLKSCETMGNANTVCSDKTGTLTQNSMTVVAVDTGKLQWLMEEGKPTLSPELSNLIAESVFLNSTVYEEAGSPETLIGSKTESALVNFARNELDYGVGQLDEYRNKHNVSRVVPFDSGRKYMMTFIPLEAPNTYRILVKGAAEIVLGKTVDFPGKQDVQAQIDNYASKALRVISLAYKDMEFSEDPQSIDLAEFDFGHLDFIAIMGIQDPLREGVQEAVAKCQHAGVVVRMVTGDNVATAKAIALNAGILIEGDKDAIVMEGPNFRKLTPEDMKVVVPHLRVLARSSPEDKRILVEYLKAQHEIVAVTGDGTNDAPALRLADVGFSMGVSGTEVAKEASDIIIMDDNFASIVKALKWGRTVNDAVKKFLQFQLTVNVTAVVLTFVSAVSNKENESVLTAVQLLWVNLIMDTLAALALATDPPSESVLDRPPDPRKASLITFGMWKMILGQSVFQLAVTFTLHFAGPQLFGYTPEEMDMNRKDEFAAFVFNTFVWMQFFNMWVNRRLDNRQNIFEGIFRNKFFIPIMGVIAGFQVLIMFVGGAAFSVKRQTGGQWATAVICGIISIPVGGLIRLVPNWVLERYYPRWLVHPVLIAFDYVWKGLVLLCWPIKFVFGALFSSIARLFRRKSSDDDDTVNDVTEVEVVTPDSKALK